MGIFAAVSGAIKALLISIGEYGLLSFRSFRELLLGNLDWSEVISLLERNGIQSLPSVTLTAIFIGLAMSVQMASVLVRQYGAGNWVGGFVAIALIRELAPVCVAVVLSGNIGAALTAEIGTMKATEQIDAMKVFRLSPINYLVLPRLVSTLIAGPILTVYGAYIALLTGQIAAQILIQVSPSLFWDSVHLKLNLIDISDMMVKSVVFSVAIILISLINGLATSASSESVGLMTTRTVVLCLVAIFILNCLVTSVYYVVNQ